MAEETAGPETVNSDGEIRKSNLCVLIQATINFPFPCLGLLVGAVVTGAPVATNHLGTFILYLVHQRLVGLGCKEEITKVVLCSSRRRQSHSE